MHFYPEYENYNDVIIEIYTSIKNDSGVYTTIPYIVSRAHQVEGENDNGGVHFESLNFKAERNSTVALNGSRSHIGAEGTLNLIDYENNLCNRLLTHAKCWDDYTKNKKDDDKNAPEYNIRLNISISCFTGTEKYIGYIHEYEYDFGVAFPTIRIKWKALPIQVPYNAADHGVGLWYSVSLLYKYLFKDSNEKHYKNNRKLVDDVPWEIILDNDADKNNPIHITDETYEELDKYLQFASETQASKKEREKTEEDQKSSGKDERYYPSYDDNNKYHYAAYDLTKLSSSGIEIIDIYNWFAQNVVLKDKKYTIEYTDDKGVKQSEQIPYSLTGNIISNQENNEKSTGDSAKSIFRFTVNDENSNRFNTVKSEVCAGLIFVQNGKFEPYHWHEGAGRFIIPTVDFKFTVNNNNLFAMNDILQSTNHTYITNYIPQEIAEALKGTNTAFATNVMQTYNKTVDKNSKSTVTFTCYNVMCFELHNPEAYVLFEVYDAYGNRHPVSGKGVVTDVSYELSDAVVKAIVTITKSYNTLIKNSDGKEIAEYDGDILADDSKFAETDEQNKSYLENKQKEDKELIEKYFELLPVYVSYTLDDSSTKDVTKDDLTALEQDIYINAMHSLTNRNLNYLNDLPDEKQRVIVHASYCRATRSKIAAKEKKIQEEANKKKNNKNKDEQSNKDTADNEGSTTVDDQSQAAGEIVQ